MSLIEPVDVNSKVPVEAVIERRKEGIGHVLMSTVMDFLVDLSTLICGIMLFYYGIMFIAKLRPGFLPMTGWPTWIQYIPAPMGGFIMTFDSLLFLFHILDPDDLLYSEKEIDYQELVKEQQAELAAGKGGNN